MAAAVPNLGQVYWTMGLLCNGVQLVLVRFHNDALVQAQCQLVVGASGDFQVDDLKNHVLVSEDKYEDSMGLFYQHVQFSAQGQHMMLFG